MLKKHYLQLSVISLILVIAGFTLMLSGGSFGTSLGKSWLFNQEGGAANADQYMMVIENYIKSFLVSGGILFGTGILTVTLTYFVYLFHGIRNTND